MNEIRRFLLNDLNVRGVIVQANSEWQHLLQHKLYSPAMITLLGDATASALLMSSHFKAEKRLTLQIQSQGKLKFLVVQTDPSHRFRAMINLDESVVSSSEQLIDIVDSSAALVMSIESTMSQTPYQGITQVTHNRLSENVENYFNQSEQLQTQLFTQADKSGFVGVLLQVLPGKTISDDDWHRLKILTETLSIKESAIKNSETLIQHLYAEDDVVVYPQAPIQFKCQCSAAKTQAMLHTLNLNELADIVAAQEDTIIDCDFCGQHYTHTPSDVLEIIAQKQSPN